MSVLGGYLNGTVTGSYCHRRLVVTTAIFKMELTMELQWSVITGWRVPCRAQSLIASHWYLRLGDNRVQAPCTHEGRHDLG